MRRLLIIACSQRKRLDVAFLPAIERYDGPAFRVLRRYNRLTQDADLSVYILSAKFGLIPSTVPIPFYDKKMTSKRADYLKASVMAATFTAIKHHKPSQVFVCAGKTYLRAFGDLTNFARHVSTARGGQGQKLTSLKAWLHTR
jgi:hypothetical protein